MHMLNQYIPWQEPKRPTTVNPPPFSHQSHLQLSKFPLQLHTLRAINTIHHKNFKIDSNLVQVIVGLVSLVRIIASLIPSHEQSPNTTIYHIPFKQMLHTLKIQCPFKQMLHTFKIQCPDLKVFGESLGGKPLYLHPHAHHQSPQSPQSPQGLTITSFNTPIKDISLSLSLFLSYHRSLLYVLNLFNRPAEETHYRRNN